jgi:microcystin-dependent protein
MMKMKALKKIMVCMAVVAVTLFSGLKETPKAYAEEQMLGEIRMFAGNFAPRGWAFCNGQVLSISTNSALFSLLGTTYGGNGTSTFALPDLRGRSPVGAGQGPGLQNYVLGQQGGTESQTILSSNMPAHTHSLSDPASTSQGTSNTPGTDKILAKAVTPDRQEVNIYTTASPDTSLKSSSAGVAGNSLPLATRAPYLAINYIIAVEGVYPSRDY